ncbi:MAG: spore coat U domain-containing protein [Smithella sp.]
MKYLRLIITILLLTSIEASASSTHPSTVKTPSPVPVVKVAATTASLLCNPLIFGDYIGGQTLTATSTISITLQGPVQAYTLAIDAGQYSSGGFNRRMNSGRNYISYNLYTDAACSQIWGDSTAGTSIITGTTNNTYTVYGKVPGNQNLPAGLYSDVVTIILSW